MIEVLFIAIIGLATIILILLLKYYSSLKKLKRFEELAEKGEKILNHGIEKEIRDLREELEAVRKSMGAERGIIQRIKKVFGK